MKLPLPELREAISNFLAPPEDNVIHKSSMDYYNRCHRDLPDPVNHHVSTASKAKRYVLVLPRAGEPVPAERFNFSTR